MFKSNRRNVVIALLVAICLWGYVTGSVNPESTQKFVQVPIEFINEDNLYSNNLAIDSVELDAVDISVKGSRTAISKLKADDIHVVADLYDRNKGNNYVSLDVELPRGITLDSVSQEKIVVQIDDLESEKFDVEAEASGELPDGMVLGAAEVEPDEVTVYGTSGNLVKIDKAVAMIDGEELDEDSRTYKADVVLQDQAGTMVKYVTPSVNQVEVNVNLERYKRVALLAETTGEPPEGYEVEKIEIPEYVYIVGKSKAVNEISSLTAGDIDLSQITESGKVELDIPLPEGVRIKDNRKVYATITMGETQEKTLTFQPDEISVTGADDSYNVEILGPVNVVLRGSTSALNGLSKDDVTVSADVSGLGKGDHRVEVNVQIKGGADGVTAEADPEKVSIYMEEK